MARVPPTHADGTLGTAVRWNQQGLELDLQSELDGPRLIDLSPEPTER